MNLSVCLLCQHRNSLKISHLRHLDVENCKEKKSEIQ